MSSRVTPNEVEGPSMKKWYVYIAQARTNRYYTGITTDAEARIKKHNSGRGSRFALEQGPLSLVFVSPPFQSKSEARVREIKIKPWAQEKKQKLISGEWSLL